MKVQTPRGKAAEREKLIERFFNSKLLISGEPFGTAELSHNLKIKRQAANNLLNYLSDQRLIYLSKDNQNRLICTGRKSGIAYGSWRKHTNEELGIK